MDRKNRLKEAYKYLQSIGKIHTQKGFADALGKAEGTISRAFNGDEKALTDNLFIQITLSFPGLFNLDYLLTGEGSLLVEEGSSKVQDTDSGELSALRSRIPFASIAANDCEIPTETIGKCLAHAWSKNTVTARYISDDRRKVDGAFALVMDRVRG